MLKTPDLSKEFHPYPKQGKKIKKGKVEKWSDGRAKLKSQFRDMGTISCEGEFVKDCRKKNYLSFAHKDKRNNLTDEEIADKDSVALLCIPCHDYIERLPRLEMREIIEKIVIRRGW